MCFTYNVNAVTVSKLKLKNCGFFHKTTQTEIVFSGNGTAVNPACCGQHGGALQTLTRPKSVACYYWVTSKLTRNRTEFLPVKTTTGTGYTITQNRMDKILKLYITLRETFPYKNTINTLLIRSFAPSETCDGKWRSILEIRRYVAVLPSASNGGLPHRNS